MSEVIAPPAATRHRPPRVWAWAVAALVIILAAAGFYATYGRGPDVTYVTMPATRGAITRSVSATGTVNPVLTIIVGTYVSGVIQDVSCDFNTRVKKGQVCAKIDPRPYQAVVDEDRANLGVAQAQLEKDKANLEYARLNYERNASLAQKQFASQDAADNAKSLFAQAAAQVALDQATIAQHQAELEASTINLGFTDIISPVDGTVVARNVTMGQTVAATFQTPTLFLIATDLTQMEVDTNVSESDIGSMREGDPASFTVGAFPGRMFHGKVVQVRQSPQSIQNVVTYDVVVGVDNTDLALKPGMTAAVAIIAAERRDVLRVPDQALRFRPTGAASLPALPEDQQRIWVLRADQPVAVPVQTGLDDDTNSEVLQGSLQPGERVIIGEQRQSAARVPTPRL